MYKSQEYFFSFFPLRFVFYVEHKYKTNKIIINGQTQKLNLPGLNRLDMMHK